MTEISLTFFIYSCHFSYDLILTSLDVRFALRQSSLNVYETFSRNQEARSLTDQLLIHLKIERLVRNLTPTNGIKKSRPLIT